MSKKALVFAPKFNHQNVDATGAFQPEAVKFCSANLLGTRPYFFNNSEMNSFESRRIDCERHFVAQSDVEVVAFFCHGWKNGIQAGWVRGTIHKLARSLQEVCVPEPTIILYACDTARDADQRQDDDLQPGPGGDGGFADMLRDDCVALGFRPTIYAHAREGHTTWNPWTRVFRPDEAAGGSWVIDPHSELWPKWVKHLNPNAKVGGRFVTDKFNDFRFRFPFMTAEAIKAELQTAK